MPELPEVETMRRDLRPKLRGAVVSEAWCDWPNMIRTPAPEAFLAALAGHKITAVERRAKWLVLRFDGRLALTIQPKMTGTPYLATAGDVRDKHDHFGLIFADGREFRIRDIRKFARFGLYERLASGELRDQEGRDPFAALGPEPLDPEFSYERFKARLAGRRGKLKPLLLDQAVIVGIGNIYADEALWIARLHPERGVESLNGYERHRLYNTIIALLDEALRNRGSSISDYQPPNGDARMQERLRVYQREGQPCQRCRTPIERSVVAGRGTYLCPRCQKASAVA